MTQRLDERMSYDDLFRISDPKRVARSFKVRGPPLDIDSYQDAVYYIFNFKANPSTTGLRHKGYVKFFRPRNPRRTPLQKLECLVDCTCPDFRYRWSWANKQRGSSRVGPSSLNQAWNRAPRKTNPEGKPGHCKHILAAREYIYGLLSSFPGDEPDTAEKLNKLTKYATKRWANFPQLMAQAKEREAEIKRRIAMRNLGRPVTPAEVEKVKLQPPKPPEPLKAPKAPKAAEPAKPPKAAPPAKPTAPLKTKIPEVPPVPVPSTKKTSPTSPAAKGKVPTVPPAPVAKGKAPVKPVKKPAGKYGPYGWYRPESKLERERLALLESVVKANAELMTTLQEAQKVVQEMEDDALSFAGPAEAPMGGAETAEPMEPMEPPISDTAIGADTEADTALGLLRQMKDLLTQLVTALAPDTAGMEGELGGELGAEGGMPGEMGGLPSEDEMPGEPPTDADIPDEAGEGGGFEGEEHEASETPGEEEAEHKEGGEEEDEPKEKEKEVEEHRAPRNRRPVA